MPTRKHTKRASHIDILFRQEDQLLKNWPDGLKSNLRTIRESIGHI